MNACKCGARRGAGGLRGPHGQRQPARDVRAAAERGRNERSNERRDLGKKTFEQLKFIGQEIINSGKRARVALEKQKRDGSSSKSWISDGARDYMRARRLNAEGNEDVEQYLEMLSSQMREGDRSFASGVKAVATGVQQAICTVFEQIRYKYYNWRTDTSSDLLLILFFNILLICFGTGFKYIVVDPVLKAKGVEAGASVEAAAAAGTKTGEGLWQDFYEVALLTFGENFPDVGDAAVLQAYSVGMALVGVVAFALVVALTEQFILEVLDQNVQEGTRVFEQGHVVVLVHCVAGKDLESIWRILNQTMCAYEPYGGKTIVVLSSRSKVEMEKVFRRAIPDTQNSKMIFRKGSPLLPADLQQVSCASASSIIVVSDNSRIDGEADAQTIRTCVLLDELFEQRRSRRARLRLPRPRYQPPSVIAEIQRSSNASTVEFESQLDIHMVMTRNLNAKRIAHLVVSPVFAGVSGALFDFRSDSQQYAQRCPQLAGLLFADVPFMFSKATVLGVFSAADNGNLLITPEAGYRMREDDQLLLLHPGSMHKQQVSPNMAASRPHMGDWKPTLTLESRSLEEAMVAMEAEKGLTGVEVLADDGAEAREAAPTDTPERRAYLPSQAPDVASSQQSEGKRRRRYVLPGQLAGEADRDMPMNVIVVGWGQPGFMETLLQELDSGKHALPVGSKILFLNTHPLEHIEKVVARACSTGCLRVFHVEGNPLEAETFFSLIDIASFHCAVCLSDSYWIDCDDDSSNGVDFMEQGDMLRLDSMLLLVQLHLRAALQAQSLPDINIICEKMAIAGVTRFEDRFKLPIGTSINSTSYAARMLVQTMFDPEHNIQLLSSLGEGVDMLLVDSSALCGLSEMLSWWDVLARAQKSRYCLVAYTDIPNRVDIPIRLTCNPRDRSQREIWNNGSGRRKLICFCARTSVREQDTVDLHWKRRGAGAAVKQDGARLSDSPVSKARAA